jgi:5-methylcytosine-specific restriction endonuclease McrA
VRFGATECGGARSAEKRVSGRRSTRDSKVRFLLTELAGAPCRESPIALAKQVRGASRARGCFFWCESPVRVFSRLIARVGAAQSPRKHGCSVERMESMTNAAHSIPHVTSVQDLAHSVERLTDSELLAGTRRLVGRSNRLLAELLAHLGEVEARGIHRIRACSSLYAYCIYELRFSEDEAFRRVAAARLTRRFPALLEAVSAGELHLTGLLMLGPHLTESNLVEVLARAKHRTKRELTRLVRVLDPLPAVPARIEPLGPAPARHIPETPTWEAFVQSMCPVRELTPGDRPRDWAEGAHEGANDVASASPDAGEESSALQTDASAPASPAREDAVAPGSLVPERYKVQFTATAEYVSLVEEAKALLSRAHRQATLEELHLRAMRALVSELTKKKYAVNDAAPREPKRESGNRAASCTAPPDDASSVPHHTRRRGRHIPAAIRRAVFERDGNQCTYVSTTGKRCEETHRLEFHHLTPFAAGGEHAVSNVTLRCAAHNALAAEEAFGRELVEEKKRASGHDAFHSQGPGDSPGARSAHEPRGCG